MVAAQGDRVLRATAVVVSWLRRNDCQRAMLFLTVVMVMHVPSAYPAAAQQEKITGGSSRHLLLCLAQGNTVLAVRPQDLLCPRSLSVDPYL